MTATVQRIQPIITVNFAIAVGTALPLRFYYENVKKL